MRKVITIEGKKTVQIWYVGKHKATIKWYDFRKIVFLKTDQ